MPPSDKQRKSHTAPDLQAIARALYVKSGYSLAQLSQQLHLPNETLSRWAHQGQWAEAKAAYQSSAGELSRRLLHANLALVEQAEANNRPLQQPEVDQLRKNALSIRALQQREFNLMTIVSVFRAFDDFLFSVEEGPLVQQLYPLQLQFVHRLLEEDYA